VGEMDYQNDESYTLLNKNLDGAKRGRLSEKFEVVVALKDVPLKERRKEAKKPLYLIRYE
jgi:hypothetical protein